MQQHVVSADRRLCVPLLIGVTGHRDIRAEDEPVLASTLFRVFSELSQQYRSTPILLLSSLAEGADCLVARIALEQRIDVCAVLPMPEDYYLQDFSSEHSIAEFKRLRAHAQWALMTPLGEGIDLESLRSPTVRETQYIQTSLFIARYSHILIALWDGKHSPAPGGTYYAVRARLDGNAGFDGAASDVLEPPVVGLIYHVITPRQSAPAPTEIAGSLKILYPSSTPSPHYYQNVLGLLDQYNADLLQWCSRHQTALPTSEEGDSTIIYSPSLDEFHRQFVVTDAMANHYQHRTQRVFIGLFALVFTAATAFDIYAHLHSWTGKVGLIGYVTIFTGAYLWYRIAHRHRYQSKYLDYRAVAEGMRVQFHWHIAALAMMVGDHYLRKQKSEIDWIRYALNAATVKLRGGVAEHHHISLMHRLEFAARHWVELQHQYFAKAHRREIRRLGQLNRWITITFGTAFLLAIVQLLVADTYAIIIPMGLLPVLAALLVGFVEKMGLHGHVKSSKYMADLFHRAERRLAAALQRGDHHAAQQVLYELGKEALGENADWLLYHRERPLEVPKG